MGGQTLSPFCVNWKAVLYDPPPPPTNFIAAFYYVSVHEIQIPSPQKKGGIPIEALIFYTQIYVDMCVYYLTECFSQLQCTAQKKYDA